MPFFVTQGRMLLVPFDHIIVVKDNFFEILRTIKCIFLEAIKLMKHQIKNTSDHKHKYIFRMIEMIECIWSLPTSL